MPGKARDPGTACCQQGCKDARGEILKVTTDHRGLPARLPYEGDTDRCELPQRTGSLISASVLTHSWGVSPRNEGAQEYLLVHN